MGRGRVGLGQARVGEERERGGRGDEVKWTGIFVYLL